MENKTHTLELLLGTQRLESRNLGWIPEAVPWKAKWVDISSSVWDLIEQVLFNQTLVRVGYQVNHLKRLKTFELFETTDSTELFDFFIPQVAHQVNPFIVQATLFSGMSPGCLHIPCSCYQTVSKTVSMEMHLALHMVGPLSFDVSRLVTPLETSQSLYTC